VVPGQHWPKKKVNETPSQQKKLGLMAGACHPIYGRKHKIRGLWYSLVWVKSNTLQQKELEAWLKLYLPA
jgi:hypothetical protein